MTNINHIFFCFVALICAVASYTGPDLPPGPYCGKRNECCVNRKDSCAHMILGTLCYCDQFCNHNATHDDCCPDYAEVCLGVRSTTPEPQFLLLSCQHKARTYLPGESRKEDCNTCECVHYNTTTAVWRCETDECLINDQVVRGVNRPDSSWTATNYSQFQGKKLNDAVVYYLGTLDLSPETTRMGAIKYEKDIPYPSNFDARHMWPNYISPVVDQEWCGADWAVSIAGVTSDRFAIQSNGAENQVLSPQVLLSCNRRQQQGCEGGHIDVAWTFVRTHGLVDEDCLPYKASVVPCPFRRKNNLLEDGCKPSNPLRTSRYRVGPPGRLADEKDIMYDIMESGPVQAVMTVYQDFFHYRSGVYRRSHHGNNRVKGLHSVRIIGWGEDQGDKFWIVANSWGRQWGENGYFRIAKGENESGIESFVVTVLVDVAGANKRK